MFASVDVVSKEEIVCLRREASILEKSEKIPSSIQRLENITASVLALLQEVSLELLKEDKEVLVISGQGVFTDDSLHGQCIFTRGVESVHLSEDGRVIVTSQFMTVLFNTDS